MITTTVAGSMAAIDPQAYDALADPNDPFVRHAFLQALEHSGSVGSRQSGWVPRHLLAYAGADLVGAVPLYEKYDSYGEFIFDWAWAEAALQAGLPYYPKLVAAVPFTPATGRRLLLHPQVDATSAAAIAEALRQGMRAVADAAAASSIHVLFCTPACQQALLPGGFLQRRSLQFHWQRQDHWQTFDDYLAALRAPARKQVRKERRLAQAHGLRLQMKPGADLDAADLAALYTFYRQTVAEKGACPYLTAAFFAGLNQPAMAAQVVASLAYDGDEAVAGALFFCQGKHLYGRYWGARRSLPGAASAAPAYDALHFELCYYLPIAWCLQQGLAHFEAGAQGAHKLRRGLLPQACHSAHWLRHPGLAAAVGRFIQQEQQGVGEQIEHYAAHTPFNRADLPALP